MQRKQNRIIKAAAHSHRVHSSYPFSPILCFLLYSAKRGANTGKQADPLENDIQHQYYSPMYQKHTATGLAGCGSVLSWIQQNAINADCLN